MKEAARSQPVLLLLLLHQGRMGFEAWFGKTVEVTAEQRAAVLAA